MKSILLSLFLLFSSQQPDKTVYICGSGKAPKFHYNAKCRGLSNCNFKTVKTTLNKAKKKVKLYANGKINSCTYFITSQFGCDTKQQYSS
ncbi:hypothetical protein [Pedobacter sp.]